MKRALVLLVVAASAHAAETHGTADRVAYIASALAAVQKAPREALQRADEYARALARGACASPSPRLSAECLMTAARRYCRDKGADCAVTMDILVSNLLGESQLVPLARRYQIMTREKDYRRALARELRRAEGVLAVDFRLRAGDAGDGVRLAAAIDRYCLGSADETNLAWQTCVSSLVWFIGRNDE
jgi:hypothetical protein